MDKFAVQLQLEDIRDKRRMWKDCYNTFSFNVNKVMRRLLHEAAANYMSVEEVAKATGLKHSQVRKEMRRAGLDPRDGKTLLAKHAAEALTGNAELLGIHPNEMDLMSPLAYLPAGSELRQQITDQTVSQVTELPEDHDRSPWVIQQIGHREDELFEVYTKDEEFIATFNAREDAEAVVALWNAHVSGNSPLAYLPAGSELQQQITDQTVSQVTELEDRLYQVIVSQFEGMGEAWTTDESGDTLARAAARVAAREVNAS